MTNAPPNPNTREKIISHCWLPIAGEIDTPNIFSITTTNIFNEIRIPILTQTKRRILLNIKTITWYKAR